MKPKIQIVDDLAPEDAAMVQALYSRSPASVNEHLKKVSEVGSGNFMDKFYVGYGHRSIGDCGTTTIFIEGVTMLVAKAIQDWPLYSGQEASTRYMDFSESEFANPVGSVYGENIQEDWREFYLNYQESVRKHLQEKYPRQAGEDEKVYERAINARSFDILRAFLPAGATTNLSWTTNLRQAQDHLAWLLNHPDHQVRSVALDIMVALKHRYRHSFDFTYLPDVSAYRFNVMSDNYFVSGVEYQEVHLYTGMREGHLHEDLAMLKNRPKGAEPPWFLAEHGAITSTFMLDFGSFRDLQRHRNGVVRMPLLTTRYGFHGWYLDELPTDLAGQAIKLLERQEDAISKMHFDGPTKQNYIAMGYKVPCRVTQSLPALIYRLELRSSKTVHPTLRQVVHEEIHQFRSLFPNVALHVDMDPDSWTLRRGTQTIEEKK